MKKEVKNMKIAAILGYIASLLFYITAIDYFINHNYTGAVTNMCLGSAWLCIASVWASRLKKAKKEEEENQTDTSENGDKFDEQ